MVADSVASANLWAGVVLRNLLRLGGSLVICWSFCLLSGFRATALLRPPLASAGGGRLDKEQEVLMKRFMEDKWTNRVAVAVWVAVTLAVWLLR